MRDSILYPRRYWAIQIGIVATGVCAVLLGAIIIRAVSVKPPQRMLVQMRINGLGDKAPADGAVYWMDATSGTVRIVGRFTASTEDGHVELHLPPSIVEDAPRVTGVFWPAGATSYVPHMHFLFDADLKNRLETIMEGVWDDPAVRDRFNEFIRTPGFRNVVIDFIVARFAARQRGKQTEPRHPKTDNRRGNDFWDRFEDESLPGWSDNEADMASQRREIVNDPEMNRALEKLLEDLEPFFRSALDEILWSRADDVPNARLIWVARRTLMGSGNPAILLIKDSDGSPIRDQGVLGCREAP